MTAWPFRGRMSAEPVVQVAVVDVPPLDMPGFGAVRVAVRSAEGSRRRGPGGGGGRRSGPFGLDPTTYGKTTHNFRQWQRLKELPNLLHTNGVEWRLWRYGEPAMAPAHVHTLDLKKASAKLTAPPSLELMLTTFLGWTPVPITSVSGLVETLAPLARLLREEVAESLRHERKAKKAGKEDHELPLLGLSRDWRKMLFPQAKDDEFADGFAQTVVFALLLAVTEGIDSRSSDAGRGGTPGRHPQLSTPAVLRRAFPQAAARRTDTS